ncbi:hypothetical protein [Myxococcus qinghaiensis]|nr:hypothetical protein [Myxococcus qinghaiensis]
MKSHVFRHCASSLSRSVHAKPCSQSVVVSEYSLSAGVAVQA